ncbi:MAG: 5-oxoprolinase subunit PxpA [Bacteroidota bacterium]
METVIDLNCDVGEGIGNEKDILPLISSCNIACGGHAGDIITMQNVTKLAKEHHVKVGAHPSYPDRENFGRVSIYMPKEKLIETLKEQIDRLISVLRTEEIPLHHIKPHGALYNDVAKKKELALIFLEGIEAYRAKTFLYVPYGSIIEKLARKKRFHIKLEAFGDRAYTENLSLVPRSRSNAMIEDPKAVFEHLLFMIKKGRVKTIAGNTVKIKADTYCIHGDTPLALEILMYLSKTLPNKAIYIKK